MPHRDFISSKLRELYFEDMVIHDWGCGGKPAKNYISLGDYVRYIGIDKNPLSQADLHCDFSENPCLIDTQYAKVAFCIEVLEHAKHPDQVLRNIANNLETGGTLYLSVPFLFEKHHEEDYWRFTDIGIRFLLENAGFEIEEIYATTEDNQGWFIKAIKV